MKVYEKLLMNREGLTENGPINIVIFGASISHAAFNDYFDFEAVYWNRLRQKLNAYRNYIPVNMICAAIGGTTAHKSLPRLESQVLVHRPDLVIVSFGLNDVNGELDVYLDALREIFEKCQSVGSDVIFMTQNMMNTYVAQGTPERFWEYAHKTAEMQTSGRVERYFASASALAQSMGVTVCDCYARWKALYESGVDTTLLLSNRINHPTEKMHELFADALFEAIVGAPCEDSKADDAMYRA